MEIEKKLNELLKSDISEQELQGSVAILSDVFNKGIEARMIGTEEHDAFFTKLDGVLGEIYKAKKDLSKLRKVQKMVTRGGKTFVQTYYEKVEGGKEGLRINESQRKTVENKPVGSTHEHNGKKYKKQGNGKWVEVSEQGMTKHEYNREIVEKQVGQRKSVMRSGKRNVTVDKKIQELSDIASKLSDKEYSGWEFTDQKKIFEEFLDEDTGEVVNIERNIEIHPISVKVEIENKISELQDKLAPIRDERNKVYDETLELKLEIEDKKSEVRELQKQLRQAHFDQEQDIVNAQKVSPEEADRVAQEYGGLMNDLETQISTLAQEIPPLVKRYNERDEALMDIEDDIEPIEEEIENLKMKLDTMTFEVADTLNKFPLDYTDENNLLT